MKNTFVGYFEDVKGYRILQSNLIKIIIWRYVKFDENISAYELNLVFMPYLTYKHSLTYVPSSSLDGTPSIFTSSNNDSEDEIPPSPSHNPFPEILPAS